MGQIANTRKLYKEVINEITKSEENWLSFLDSCSWHFKYNFVDKILIYAQRPEATACAEMEKEWNKKCHRWVNKDAKGIFVLSNDENSPYPFRLVFDVSDTHNSKGTEYKLWSVKPEYEEKIIETLDLSLGGDDESNDLAKSIIINSYNMVIDNILDYLDTIYQNKAGTMLEDLSESEIKNIIISIVWASTSYMMMSRSGINAREKIGINEFSFIKGFNNDKIITALGTAISDIAEMGIKEIAKTVINLQNEEKIKNHTFVKNEEQEYPKNKGGNENGENRIQASWRVSNTKSSNGEREYSRWKIRKNEATLFKRVQESRLPDIIDGQEFSKSLKSNTGNSNKEIELNNRTDEKRTRDNGEIERNKSNGMGRTDEQYSSNSRADSSRRDNLQLEQDNIGEGAENASFFTEEFINKIIENSPYIIKRRTEFKDYIFDNCEEIDKCKAYIKDILGNAYTEFEIENQRVGYKVNDNNLNIWKGDYLHRTEECFKEWDEITKSCISNNVHYMTPEYNKDKYTFIVGDTIYIGQQEFVITDLNNGTMTIYDTKFPLDIKTIVIDDVILKIAENPLNDYLKEDRGITETTNNSFEKWLDTFIEEKGIDLEDTFSLEGDESFHIFEVGNVIENIKKAPPQEQAKIKDMLVKIDFNNGNVLDYLQHLAKALVKAYEQEQTQEKENKVEDNNTKQNDITEKIIKRNKSIEYFDVHPDVPIEERINFKIINDNLGIGTDKEKYKNNIEAIKVLKLCEKEDRFATKEEQEILSKYIGWGGLKAVFEENNNSWSKEYLELKNLLTDEEYENAKASSVTAYYTPPIVIRNIYKALQNMGLKEANILEPSCRSRQFYGNVTR